MAHITARTVNGRTRYLARYLDASGKERSKTFRSEASAEHFLIQAEAAKLNGAYREPAAERLTFNRWTDQWWEVWAADPDRSPTTLAAADSRLRLHLRPWFGRHKLGEIKPSLVRQWQHELHGRLAHASVLACRSLLNRILQAAEDEGVLAANPVRKVPPPRRPVDPEVIFGRTRPRIFTPTQLGQLLTHARSEDRDRLLILAGTGLRAGELCGLRRERVQLRERRLEVVTVRYDAGRFGRGYKHRPKSTAGIRVVPLAGAVVEVLARYLPGDRSSLLFPEASRYVLRHGYLRAVRQATRHGYLVSLDLRGPHDLRHTFATWLEDDGIPTRVIDELMGHAATRRPSWASERGSAMGAVYRHTTAEMEARVVRALDARLATVRSVLDGLDDGTYTG
jgi:integrase